MSRIIAIPAFSDNYIWLIQSHDRKQACVVDPGQAEQVLEYLRSHSLNLQSILITHNHYDHVNGIQALCDVFPDCRVYGPALEDFPNKQVSLSDQDKVVFDDLHFTVMDVPGHTIGHIAYSCEQQGILFCGDTLFGMGCGRLRGGTAEQLYQSLQYISALPGDTIVYCTHEYTQENLVFARAVDPDNQLIVEHQRYIGKLREKGEPSVPLLLKDEIKKNPFLRCHEETIKKSVEMHSQQVLQNPSAVFKQLRRWKDHF